MMKKYLGNSYQRNDDYDSDNAVNGRVMMMLRLMIIMILVEAMIILSSSFLSS